MTTIKGNTIFKFYLKYCEYSMSWLSFEIAIELYIEIYIEIEIKNITENKTINLNKKKDRELQPYLRQ